MFCKVCGTENAEGARFCASCGSDLTPVAAPAQPVYQETYYQEPAQPVETPVAENPAPAAPNGFEQTVDTVKNGAGEALKKAGDFGKNYMEAAKKDKKKLIIPAVAVVVVIALIIVLISSLGGGYKSALDTYMKIANGKITEKNIEKMFPEEFWEDSEMDPDDIAEMLEEAYEEDLDDLKDEYGKNVKFSYKVIDKEKMDEDDLEVLTDELHDSWGVKWKDVKKAYELEVEITTKGSEDKTTDEIDMVVVKIGSKWYIAEGMNF